MSHTRRSQVIHLLQRQARLECDQMVDAHAHFMERHRRTSDELETLNQQQATAHGHLRQFVSLGAEINPDLYRVVTRAAAERTTRITTAVREVGVAEVKVDGSRLKLHQQEEKIEKLNDFQNKEKVRQSKLDAIAEFNINDTLWLSRRGVQK